MRCRGVSLINPFVLCFLFLHFLVFWGIYNTAENKLAGSIPPEIALFDSLQELFLQNNTLTGPLPDSFANLRLSEMDVERNQLTGNPFSILTQIPNLSRLRISSNNFSGNLPASIAVWDRMVEFWLADNFFTGTLPAELGDMVNLQTLFLYGNEFTGPLPSELGNLRLFAFQAQRNRLTGAIPVQFYNNVDLTFLRLDVNELSGSISGISAPASASAFAPSVSRHSMP